MVRMLDSHKQNSQSCTLKFAKSTPGQGSRQGFDCLIYGKAAMSSCAQKAAASVTI